MAALLKVHLRSSVIAKIKRAAVRGRTPQTLRSALIAKKSPGAIFDIAPAMARRETAKDGGRKIERAGMAGPFGVHAYSMSLSADRRACAWPRRAASGCPRAAPLRA